MALSNLGLIQMGGAMLRPGGSLGDGFLAYGNGIQADAHMRGQEAQTEAMQAKMRMLMQQSQMEQAAARQQAEARRAFQDRLTAQQAPTSPASAPAAEATRAGLNGPLGSGTFGIDPLAALTQQNPPSAPPPANKPLWDALLVEQAIQAGRTPEQIKLLAEASTLGVPKAKDPIKVGQGDTLVDPTTFKPLFKGEKPIDWNQLIVAGPNGEPMVNEMLLKAQIEKAKAGRSSVTVNNAPTGYRWKDGGTAMEPIPGSKAALEHDKAAQEQAAAAEKSLTAARNVMNTANVVVNDIDKALGLTGMTTTGIAGALTKGIPGTDAYDLNKTVDTVKANVGFQQLQAMREASPTGGALGQVAVQELSFLQAALGNLDTGQSPAALRENLKKIRTHFDNWRKVVAEANKLPVEQPKGEQNIDDLLKKYGNG